MNAWGQNYCGMLDQSSYSKKNVFGMATLAANGDDDVKSRRFYFDVKLSRWMGILPYSNTLGFSKGWALYSYVIVAIVSVIELVRMLSGFMTTNPITTIKMMETVVKIIRLDYGQAFEVPIWALPQGSEMYLRRPYNNNNASLVFNFTRTSPEEEPISGLRKLGRNLGVMLLQCVACRRTNHFQDIMKGITDPEGRNIIRPTTSILTCVTVVSYFASFALKSWMRRQKSGQVTFGTIIKMASSPFRSYNEFLNLMVLRQFCIIVNILKLKISRLTKQIKSTPCSAEMMDKICEKNDQCLTRAKRVNDFYSLQILLMSIYIFIKILNLMYEAIISSRHDVDEWVIIMEQVGDMLYAGALLLCLLMLTGCCENAKKKINKFHAALFKAISERPYLRENERLQLYVEVSPTIEFTAYNFFTIGYPLVTSMIAAASTYLVIIVQFDAD